MHQSFAEQSEQNFRTNVRHYREQADMTQAELAKRLVDEGFLFHAQTVYKIERGERQVRLNEAVAIARALGVDVNILLNDLKVNALAELEARMMAVNRTLEEAVLTYEEVQTELADLADQSGLIPGEADDRDIDYIVCKTAASLVREVGERSRRMELSCRSELQDSDSPDASKLIKLLDGASDGPFMQMLRGARRGEHPEEA